MQGCSSYTSDNLRRTLFDSAAQRNEAFGYNYQNLPRVQSNYASNWKSNHLAGSESLDICQAGKEYYYNLSVDPSQKAVIGFTGMRPNIYDDELLPGLNMVLGQNYRSWQPGVRTANPVPMGARVEFIPHEPVELAPRQSESYWGADLNARLYQRSLLSSAIESPYSNWYARQGLMNLISQDLRVGSDPYLKSLEGPCDTFAAQIRKTGPPSATNM